MKVQELLHQVGVLESYGNPMHGAPTSGLDVEIDHDNIVHNFRDKQINLPCLLRSNKMGTQIRVIVDVKIHEAEISSGAFSHEFGIHNPGDNWDFNCEVVDVRATDPQHTQSLEQLKQQFGKNFNQLINNSIREFLSDAYYDEATDLN